MAAPILLCDTAGMSNDRWLECRMHGPKGDIPYTIGGSDVAAIFGISPWTTPLELWLIKKGRMKPKPKDNADQLEMGHLLEPIAAHWYGKKSGNYAALLGKLSLASDHRENLLSRGLTEELIRDYGYKTMPVVGFSALAKQLQSEGYYLGGVPGFYHTKEGAWTFIHERRGILIPARDQDGKIQGLQIRLDNVKKGKFRWISSIGKQDGCKAEGWTHLKGEPTQTVLLTEGPLKADVINHITGLTVIAVPGVNSLKHLQSTLEYLQSQGTTKIMTCFDMDYLKNPHVRDGYYNLANILAGVGIEYGTYLWDPQFKGLDDYVWHCRKQGTL